MSRAWYIGLDLSLRGAGMCAIPEDWGQDWSKCDTRMAGYELPAEADIYKQTRRYYDISDQISALLFDCGGHSTASRIIGIEGYAYGAHSSSSHKLAELGGVIKTQLCMTGEAVAIVAASQARRLLLGQNANKAATLRYLRAMGAPPKPSKRSPKPLEWTDDICDAWVIANALMLDAGCGLTLHEGKAS